MMQLSDLSHVVGLAARLLLFRGGLKDNPWPDEKVRLAIFRIEQQLRELGLEPEATQYTPPPTPTPPQVALRKVA